MNYRGRRYSHDIFTWFYPLPDRRKYWWRTTLYYTVSWRTWRILGSTTRHFILSFHRVTSWIHFFWDVFPKCWSNYGGTITRRIVTKSSHVNWKCCVNLSVCLILWYVQHVSKYFSTSSSSGPLNPPPSPIWLVSVKNWSGGHNSRKNVSHTPWKMFFCSRYVDVASMNEYTKRHLQKRSKIHVLWQL